MKATKFTIDRSKWARGGDSLLLDPDSGNMCCLGFYALACGVSVSAISGEPVYSDLDDSAIEELPSRLVSPRDNSWPRVTTLHDDIVNMNDDAGVAETDREVRIASLFASIGVTVEFVDGEQP